jgi:hypothetical protein
MSAAILFAGLALVALGGCFLIGVLVVVRPGVLFGPQQPYTLAGADYALMAVLYLFAGACFVGALILLIAGVRGLLQAMRI